MRLTSAGSGAASHPAAHVRRASRRRSPTSKTSVACARASCASAPMGPLTWQRWSRALPRALSHAHDFRRLRKLPDARGQASELRSRRGGAGSYRPASRISRPAIPDFGPDRHRARRPRRGPGRKSITVKELKEHILIRREPGSGDRAALDRLVGAADFPPHRLVQFGSREGVVNAVAEGVGLGAIFDDGVLPGHRVTRLAIVGAGIASKVDVVCLAERRTSQLIAGCLGNLEGVSARSAGCEEPATRLIGSAERTYFARGSAASWARRNSRHASTRVVSGELRDWTRPMRFPPPHDGDQRIDLGEIIVAAQVRCERRSHD